MYQIQLVNVCFFKREISLQQLIISVFKKVISFAAIDNLHTQKFVNSTPIATSGKKYKHSMNVLRRRYLNMFVI
jgi:hypothetical protein